MPIKISNVLFFVILWMPSDVSSTDEAKNTHTGIDYCQNESFRPRCLKNEVIMVRSATYGRMRIGRCITAEEVAALVPHFGENPPNLGCSADISAFLDRNCFAKRDCEVRAVDISAEKLKPCFPILNVYLEVTYDCISVADEGRSCSVTAYRDPIHIIGSSNKICGTASRPWHVEVSNGQRINISLIESSASNSDDDQQSNKKSCQSRGLILDKAGNRNITICGREEGQKEKELYLSIENSVDVILLQPESLDSTGDDDDSPSSFVLKLEAVGCSSIIPPEDAWLKRNDDVIVIGCYSNRQTWQLNCQQAKWIGVMGNCSQEGDGAEQVSVVKQQRSQTLSTNGEVLAIVAVCGFTLAICLAIMCIGAVCLRRLYGRMKKRDLHYKTLNHPVNTTTRGQATDQPFPIDVVTCNRFPGDELRGFGIQPSTLQPLNDGYNVNSYGVEDDANHQLN